jgi:xanthosine phosphorylase
MSLPVDSHRHELNVRDAAALIGERLRGLAPRVAVVLGSGLGGLAEKVADPVRIAYADLPGFPVTAVAGHAGELVIGRLNNTDVILMRGRQHFYETSDAMPMKTAIRALKAAGIGTLFLSNAAGSLRPEFRVSELMLITDHIGNNMVSPLTGPNDDAFGPRFVTMTGAWDKDLSAIVADTAKANGIALHSGVYMYFRGPTFETPAEIRMAKTMGADAVGMSTVPDCVIARHCGMRVAGVSCLTNMGAGLSDERLSHAHTLENAAKGAAAFEKLVSLALPRLDQNT